MRRSGLRYPPAPYCYRLDAGNCACGDDVRMIYRYIDGHSDVPGLSNYFTCGFSGFTIVVWEGIS